MTSSARTRESIHRLHWRSIYSATFTGLWMIIYFSFKTKRWRKSFPLNLFSLTPHVSGVSLWITRNTEVSNNSDRLQLFCLFLNVCKLWEVFSAGLLIFSHMHTSHHNRCLRTTHLRGWTSILFSDEKHEQCLEIHVNREKWDLCASSDRKQRGLKKDPQI